MRDQADELRQLVLRGMRRSIPQGLAPPRLVVVGGGKGGVGATTVAINLAVALARDGRPTVLVDADLSGGDVALACRLDESYSVLDVLAGKRTVHEALRLGPAGVQILPGAWGASGVVDCPPQAQERLIWELKGLGAYAEYVILDVGSSLDRVVKRFWQAADALLLVTTRDEVAVMDAYAALKVMLAGAQLAPVRALVNQVERAEEAADVHERLARAARRFLGLHVGAAGSIPYDPQVAAAAAARRPVLLEYAASAAARHLEDLAARMVAAEDVAVAESSHRPEAMPRPVSA